MTPYASAAARDSQNPAPVVGDSAYLIDSGSLVFYYGPVLGWRPPWNQPWGTVGRKHLAWSVVVPAGPYPALNYYGSISADFVAVQHRLYEVEVQAGVVSGANGDLVEIVASCFDTGENFKAWNSNPVLAALVSVSMTGTSFTPLYMRRRYEAGEDTITPGPHSFRLGAGQLTGSGGGYTSDGNYSSFIAVHDCGPSGDPVYS